MQYVENCRTESVFQRHVGSKHRFRLAEWPNGWNDKVDGFSSTKSCSRSSLVIRVERIFHGLEHLLEYKKQDFSIPKLKD